jgi:lysozyme family protein
MIPPILAALRSSESANVRRMLQRTLNVKEDGVVESSTLAAAAQTTSSIIAELIARRSVAYALAPLVGMDGLGWFRRLAKVHQVALRL